MNRNFIFCKNIKKIYQSNCSEFQITELEELITFQFIPILFGISCAFYIRNNKQLFSEFLFKICYNSFLAATKVSNAYRRFKNFFVYSSPTITTSDGVKKSCVYDEVKVIKNGLRCASFETMETFKESCYLGNPNDYYDLGEESESSSSSFDSDLVDDYTPSSSPSSSPLEVSQSSSNRSKDKNKHSQIESESKVEQLFIMKKNESNALEFTNFDFITHTNYKYPESFETSKQNYTKVYRVFTENDFYSDKTKYQPSNVEMIICTLQIDGNNSHCCSENESVKNGAEYDINLTQPYNFNVVGNFILDEKFVYWYILKKYDYAIQPSTNYKIICITKDAKLFQLDRSCGLCVHLNEYEYKKVTKSLIQ